ncbi:MAG TPA: hypothetical protein VMX56_08865 [Anaerolineales bacterium]|nr:hypothetical protein [Anaerolineales bacterium]
MDEYLINLNSYVTLAFWKVAASITGAAVRNQRLVNRVLWVAPIVLAAVLAYMFGRLFGAILLLGIAA